VKKLFKEVDVTAPLTELTKAMQQILSSDPDVRDVKWGEVS
jgi:hypothetical protein